MERSIHEVARLTSVTSRTLRHYGEIGLLPPSRTAGNGYRYYDERALVRLQRILLLRQLGLGLPGIRAVLDHGETEEAALARHLVILREEQERLARQIIAVESTIGGLKRGEEVMVNEMFDGFDHTRYRDEVTERWGAEAAAQSDDWWTGMSAADRESWQDVSARLAADWAASAESGASPTGAPAQELARRHVDWLRTVPGTPAATPGADVAAYVRGLGDVYVADARFARNYGGERGARHVRDALQAYADAEL